MRFFLVSAPLMMAEDLGGSYFGTRWSLHLARPPAWLADESGAVQDYYRRNVFDRPDIDPNATLNSIIDQVQAEANRLGIRINEDDAGRLKIYGRLQVGETSWKAIAGEGGSATPTGAGALAMPYLDAYAAAQDAAIAQFKSDPAAVAAANAYSGSGSIEGSDGVILAHLGAGGFDADAGLSKPLALSPVPQPEMRSVLALAQSSHAEPVSGASLTSFFGIGTRGSLFGGSGGGGGDVIDINATRTGGGGIPTWLLLVALAGAGYYLYTRKA